MQRIAVIGNAGGGKSGLCRKLGRALDIPLFPIDKIQWEPGWVAAPYDEIKAKHDRILAQEKWILDGPEGCPMLPVTGRLLKMIWRIHFQLRPRLVALIERQQAEKQVVHITSPKALRAFLSGIGA